tara:strand:+ start:327 stop:893 length:567 start_codon:yes stop_codon:yes gene_type:complete
MLQNEREKIRNRILSLREGTHLSEDETQKLTRNCLDSGLISNNSIIGGYWPIRKEADPRLIMEQLETIGFTIALPQVVTDTKLLKFRSWKHFHPLQPGIYRTWQPWQEQALVEPDILLVPLVAFDLHGHRLGYGGGYYDKTLSVFRAKKKIIAIGLARDFQKVELIPKSPNDQRLDYIITENNVEHIK